MHHRYLPHFHPITSLHCLCLYSYLNLMWQKKNISEQIKLWISNICSQIFIQKLWLMPASNTAEVSHTSWLEIREFVIILWQNDCIISQWPRTWRDWWTWPLRPNFLWSYLECSKSNKHFPITLLYIMYCILARDILMIKVRVTRQETCTIICILFWFTLSGLFVLGKINVWSLGHIQWDISLKCGEE